MDATACSPRTPLLSVLLPVRDALPHLAEALDSVLRTELPVEVVAVDDGSCDGSAAFLAERAAAEPRLRLHRTRPLGIVRALNLALAAARAPFVARMDADDRSLPGRLEALHAALVSRPEVAALGTGVALHPDGMQGGGMTRYVGWLNAVDEAALPREIWIESPLAHPTLAGRRETLLAAGGYREGEFPEDYDLLLRLHLAGSTLGKLPQVLYWWRDHARRLTRTHPSYGADAHRALKVDALVRGPLCGIERVAVWGAGATGRPFGRALVRAGLAVTAWIDVDPKKIGRTLHGARVAGIAELESLRGTPLLVAVGAPGARPLIRAELARRGFTETRDYWVVA